MHGRITREQHKRKAQDTVLLATVCERPKLPMIISYKHKFVFVKTTKTAGTSVEIALARHCGDDDVITKIAPEDEKIKLDQGIRGRQNTTVTLKDDRQIKLFNHAKSLRARRVIGGANWRAWFTFAFERNPYDRAVSAYCYSMKKKTLRGEPTDGLTFDVWVKTVRPLEALHKAGWGLYTNEDKIIVDKVFKFEDLEGAMSEIYQRLEIAEPSLLLQTKTSDRKPTYRELYTDETREIVAKCFAKEIAEFGYEF